MTQNILDNLYASQDREVKANRADRRRSTAMAKRKANRPEVKGRYGRERESWNHLRKSKGANAALAEIRSGLDDYLDIRIGEEWEALQRELEDRPDWDEYNDRPEEEEGPTEKEKAVEQMKIAIAKAKGMEDYVNTDNSVWVVTRDWNNGEEWDDNRGGTDEFISVHSTYERARLAALQEMYDYIEPLDRYWDVKVDPDGLYMEVGWATYQYHIAEKGLDE